MPNETYVLKITISASAKNPDNLTLNDILGDEIMSYYTGWGFNCIEKEKDFFLDDMPKNLVDSAVEKLAGRDGFKYDVRNFDPN